MSDITHPPLHEERTSTGLSSTKLAMWLFIASECMLFGGLITAYLLYRGSSLKGPYPQDVFDIGYTSVSALVVVGAPPHPGARQGLRPQAPVAHRYGDARADVRRRSGVRVHELLPRRPVAHDE